MIYWPELNFPPINLWNVWKMQDEEVPSPCNETCYLDKNAICVGCKRHVKEIEDWDKLSNQEKYDIVMRLFTEEN